MSCITSHSTIEPESTETKSGVEVFTESETNTDMKIVIETETKTEDNDKEGCCCGYECNPASQICGRCARLV